MNTAAVDAWTVVHAATGFAAQRVGVSFGTYLALATLYEVVEWNLEYPRGSAIFGTKRPESFRNMATDLVAGAVGYQAGNMT